MTATVSVLIAARNEAADIAVCLQRVVEQDVAPDSMEIVVVDGASTDGTAAVVEQVLARSGLRWTVVDGPGPTPANLNAGLKACSGEVVCRVDARSLIPPTYVARCVEVLAARADVAVAGGRQVAVARDQSTVARGIARGLNNRFGMGLARYRRAGAGDGPADTVYLGAFRRSLLEVEGGWDERFSTNQDFELNRRLSRHGVVWFDASLVVEYLPRSTLAGLWAQYRRFGRWKVAYWTGTGRRPETRQWALIGLPVVAASVGLAAMFRWGIGRSALAAVVAVAAVDVAGSERPAPVGERSVALAAGATIAGAWWTGVIAEMIRPTIAMRQ